MLSRQKSLYLLDAMLAQFTQFDATRHFCRVAWCENWGLFMSASLYDFHNLVISLLGCTYYTYFFLYFSYFMDIRHLNYSAAFRRT